MRRTIDLSKSKQTFFNIIYHIQLYRIQYIKYFKVEILRTKLTDIYHVLHTIRIFSLTFD